MDDKERQLQEASQKYYTTGDSPLTDVEFDQELRDVARINPTSPLLNLGHGYNVNKDTTPGQKCRHKYGLVGSLEKSYSWDGDQPIKSIFKNQCIDVSAKIDGLSVALYYDRGQLIQALTRGDGNLGIDITEKVIRIIGDEIADKSFSGGVRGEIVMSYKDFEEFREFHKDDPVPPKNPRNSAVGLINGKEITKDYKYLSIIVYSVIGVENVTGYFHNLDDCNSFLAYNFKDACPRMSIYTDSREVVSTLRTYRDLWSNVCPIDGVVLTSTNITQNGTSIEYTQQAFKFDAESAEAKVDHVEWIPSKSNYMIPTVWVEPTKLSGVTVTKCTGVNAKYIQDNLIGAGAVVRISRHGEVIPNIDEVVVPSTQNVGDLLPKFCSSCGTKLEWSRNTDNSSGVHLQCNKVGCSNQSLQDLLVWLKFIAPVDGLGETLKLKFLREVFSDNLTIDYVMENLDLVRTGGTSTGGAQWHLFVTMINKLRNDKIPLVNALLALNIPRIGSTTAEKLSQHPDLIKNLMSHQMGELGKLISVLGTASAQSIFSYLSKLDNLHYLYSRIIWETKVPVQRLPESLKGKVAITGKLISYKSRKEFEKVITSAGYELCDNIKECQYLITNDPDPASSKGKAAKAHNVTIISELEFLKLANPNKRTSIFGV